MTPILPLTKRARAAGWPVFFFLTALEGLAALLILASTPSDIENSRLLGFSTGRLALMAAALTGALVFAALGFQALREQWRERWLDPVRSRILFSVLFVLLPLAALLSVAAPAALNSMYHTSGDFAYNAYHQRLLPLFAWIGLASLQGFLWLAAAGNFRWRALKEMRPVLIGGLAAWAVFGLAGLFVYLTGIGVTPDVIGWGLPFVPLMEWHAVLAWAVGFLYLLLLCLWPALRLPDWSAAALIWLLAVGLWLSQPVTPGFFNTAGRAPNHEIYPFSDGAYYGLFSQSVQIGNGFKGDAVPPRPMYISLLAVFHSIAGQRYEDIVFVQGLLLAFFPVVLYFLGKELHSRPLGLMVALMAVLREATALPATPFTDNASNSKLFFADLPAAMALALWGLLILRWLKVPDRRPTAALLVGAGAGLAMLFRTQSFLILPVVLLLALPAFRLRGQAWLKSAAWIGLGLLLVAGPWVMRNWAVTGSPGFDDPQSQSGVVAQRYSLSGHDPEYVLRPGEDMETYSARVNRKIVQFLTTYPGEAARFVVGHFLNAEISNVLVFPIRFGIENPGELLAPERPFWQFWQGKVEIEHLVLLTAYTGLIALGIGASWARLRWAGLALLLMNLTYNFSMALARNSGGRYLLPVDWVFYTYGAVGMLELGAAALLVLGVSPERLRAAAGAVLQDNRAGVKLPWSRLVVVALACVLVGSLPMIVEAAYPARYPQETRADLFAAAEERAGVDPETRMALTELAQGNEGVVLRGRALYPRFYAAGEGEPRTAKTGYEPLDYARTVFLVASNDYYGLVILRSEQPPLYLPNAADVVIAGCYQGAYIDAHVVSVDGASGPYMSDVGFPEDCRPLQGQNTSSDSEISPEG